MERQSNPVEREVLVISPPESPNSCLSQSFSSVATSCGPEFAFAMRTGAKLDGSPSGLYEDEEGEEGEELELEVSEARRRECTRRRRLADGPSRRNAFLDRQAVGAARQNALNEFILRHEKAKTVSREDHHAMLQQLLGEAYRRDPQHRLSREEWRRLLVAVRKEYCGAAAIFTLAPDPYHSVLSTLSSMMMWNDNVRRFDYSYSDAEVKARRARQAAIIEKLNKEQKKFL